MEPFNQGKPRITMPMDKIFANAQGTIRRSILCLRTEFIYATHNSLYAMKEFLSILVTLF